MITANASAPFTPLEYQFADTVARGLQLVACIALTSTVLWSLFA
jgi:hypothetical protein